MGVLIPLAIKYGIPLAAYGIGHLAGWVHHEIATARAQKRQQDALKRAMQRTAGE